MPIGKSMTPGGRRFAVRPRTPTTIEVWLQLLHPPLDDWCNLVAHLAFGARRSGSNPQARKRVTAPLFLKTFIYYVNHILNIEVQKRLLLTADEVFRVRIPAVLRVRRLMVNHHVPLLSSLI